MRAKARRPFCDSDPAAVVCFDRWVKRLEALGVELGEADRYVVGVVASREARLEQLAAAVSSASDGALQLQLVQAERLAAQDVGRGLDLLERTFGASVGEVAVEEREAVSVSATGTDGRVLAFAARGGLSPVAQRIAATCARSSRPLTKDALRRRVSGSQDDFLRGLKEAVGAGGVVRTGVGKKGRPYLYARGGA